MSQKVGIPTDIPFSTMDEQQENAGTGGAPSKGEANMEPGRMRSVQEIESNMPPLRGENVDLQEYVEYTDVHQQQLQEFYDETFLKHRWDMQRRW